MRDMDTTKTKQVDRFGNVTYTISQGDQVIGTVHKTCSGYNAEFPSGSYIPTSSIKKATALLVTMQRMPAEWQAKITERAAEQAETLKGL